MQLHHRYKTWSVSLAMLAAIAIAPACNKDKLAQYNTNPDNILNPPLKSLLPTAITKLHGNNFEAFYDNIRTISVWAQATVRKGGNGGTFTVQTNNVNQRYGIFYTDIAPHLIKIENMIDALPADQKPRYVYMRAIPGVIRAYYAWYISDVIGSIPYKEAFQARQGGTMTPAYDSQSSLYATLEAELKAIVNTLKTKQPVEQETYGTSDLYFGKDNATAIGKWIKAANSLRLRMAMRLLKVAPERAKGIITEVLADNGGLISSVAEEWVFNAGASFTSDGNWNPYPDQGFSGEKNLIDFMWDNADPRIRLFFRKNSWTQENFNAAKTQGKVAASAVWDARQYYGQYSSPDATTDPAKARFFASITIKNGSADVVLDTISPIQQRLFQAEWGNGTGFTTFQLITYAEVCFMRAEIAALGISSENASEWYYKGIDASIESYDKIAKAALIHDYQAVVPAEVTAYKAKPAIAYNPAKALEQIAAQSFLNHYKNPSEAWAQIKRTGMPNANTILPLEVFKSEGTVLAMPRRFPVNYPLTGDLNFANKQKAIEDMMKDPGFGLPTDISGRVWWDKP